MEENLETVSVSLPKAALIAGFPNTEALRNWRRFHGLEPNREAASGYTVYGFRDLCLLRALAMLSEHGFKPSEAAPFIPAMRNKVAELIGNQLGPAVAVIGFARDSDNKPLVLEFSENDTAETMLKKISIAGVVTIIDFDEVRDDVKKALYQLARRRR